MCWLVLSVHRANAVKFIGVAEGGNLKLDFKAKRNSFFSFDYIFRCFRDTKTRKLFWPNP